MLISVWFITNGQIYTEKEPFQHLKSDGQVINAICNGVKPTRPDPRQLIHDEMWNLLDSCWAFEPMARPTMKDISARLPGIYRARYGRDYQPRKDKTLVSEFGFEDSPSKEVYAGEQIEGTPDGFPSAVVGSPEPSSPVRDVEVISVPSLSRRSTLANASETTPSFEASTPPQSPRNDVSGSPSSLRAKKRYYVIVRGLQVGVFYDIWYGTNTTIFQLLTF